MKPKLILVNGMPGVGKTTLAKTISERLTIPFIGKDSIKEFFFEELGVESRDDSMLYGRVAADCLQLIAKEYLKAGKSIIIENAFHYSFSKHVYEQITKQNKSSIIELYCTAQPKVIQQRFAKRNQNERHAGHNLGIGDYDPFDSVVQQTYKPLNISKLIKVDLNNFNTVDYEELYSELNKEIKAK